MKKEKAKQDVLLTPLLTKWNRWDTRVSSEKEQLKLMELFQKSGAKTKSEFVRARLLGEPFKVITVDKYAIEYYRKLSELTMQVQKIGVLYNQAVRSINSYHSVKVAQLLLQKVAHLSVQIIELQQQAVELTEDFRRR